MIEIKNRAVQRIVGMCIILLLLGMSGCVPSGEHGKHTREAAAKVQASKNRMDAASAYEKSQQLFAIGNLGEALEQIEASLKMADDVIDAQLLRLQIFLDIGRNEKEISELVATCMNRWPEEARFIYYQGVYYERRGNIEKALAAYLQAAEIDNDSVQYKMAAAEMYLEAEEREKAKAYLQKACRVHPNAPGLLQNLGYIAQMEGDLTGAQRYFLEAYSLAPTENALQENLAGVSYELGEYEEAMKLLEKLLPQKVNRNRNDLKYMAVRTALRCNRPVEAREILADLLTTPGCNQELAWKEMLNVALMLDDMLLCEEAVKQLNRLSAGSETAVLAQAVFEHKQGKVTEVRDILQEYSGAKSELFKRYQQSLQQ